MDKVLRGTVAIFLVALVGLGLVGIMGEVRWCFEVFFRALYFPLFALCRIDSHLGGHLLSALAGALGLYPLWLLITEAHSDCTRLRVDSDN